MHRVTPLHHTRSVTRRVQTWRGSRQTYCAPHWNSWRLSAEQITVRHKVASC